MKTKITILIVLGLSFILSIFNSCDKIDAPFFKPVYTDRTVLVEFIGDAESLNTTDYSNFTTLVSGNNQITPMVVLAGNTSTNGNSAEANQIVLDYNLTTSSSLGMFNRSKFNSLFGIPSENWNSKLQSEIAKKGEFTFALEGQLNIDSTTTKTYTGNLKLASLNGYSNPLNIKLFLVEDSIEINSTKVLNVLRERLETITVGEQMLREESFSYDFNYDISSYTLSQIKNLKIIGVLQDSYTYEVLQTNNIALQSTNISLESIHFNTIQKVLVEDFTGHKCGFCPKAHEELTSLKNVYGAQLVPMAIHFGYYTEVDANYPDDFTTPVADAIGNAFSVIFTPIGMVNRIEKSSSGKLFDYGEWDAKISQLISQNPKVGIALNADMVNNKIVAEIYVKAFEQVDTALKIQAFVTESHIISKQLYYGHDPEVIENYEHNHVLRASLNGFWGENLTDVPFIQNQIVNKSMNYNIDPTWNTNNLSIIVMVYNDVSKTILQVEEIHL